MSKILTILGVKDINAIPKDIKDAGELVDGMQAIYVQMPESAKKEFFARTIAESVRILIQSLRPIVDVTQTHSHDRNNRNLHPKSKSRPMKIKKRRKNMLQRKT